VFPHLSLRISFYASGLTPFIFGFLELLEDADDFLSVGLFEFLQALLAESLIELSFARVILFLNLLLILLDLFLLSQLLIQFRLIFPIISSNVLFLKVAQVT
jgi:hypothetical protein